MSVRSGPRKPPCPSIVWHCAQPASCVDGRACRRVARTRIRRALPAQLLHVGDHPPDFHLGKVEGPGISVLGMPLRIVRNSSRSEPPCRNRPVFSTAPRPPSPFWP